MSSLYLIPAAVLAILPVAEQKPGFVGVQLRFDQARGAAVIEAVINNSPAEKAGIEGGDLLLEVNSVKPRDLKAAVDVIRSMQPGKKIKIVVERAGKKRTLEVIPTAL